MSTGIGDDDLQRSEVAVKQFERAVGNKPAVWDALETIAQASQGDPWLWLAAIARRRRLRGKFMAAARIYAVVDHCHYSQLPISTPDDWRRVGMRPCDDDDVARVASDAFISLAALDNDDAIVVKNLGGQLTAIQLYLNAAMTLRELAAKGIDVMPELVELAGQALRRVGLEDPAGSGRGR